MQRKTSERLSRESRSAGVQGLHLTADLNGCQGNLDALNEAEALTALCLRAVEHSGLHAVAQLFHPFQPQGSGITGVVLLAESHLAVHTWPELAAVTLDVYVCNLACDNSAKAQSLLEELVNAFKPSSQTVQRIERGVLAPKARATRRPLASPKANDSSKTE
jgi:S-adenosylmethionine decarboxylase